MIEFEVGRKYYCISLCDHECIWRYEITHRTNKMITIKDFHEKGEKLQTYEERRLKIHISNDDVEYCYPLGKYSMCPVLCADREIKNYVNKKE